MAQSPGRNWASAWSAGGRRARPAARAAAAAAVAAALVWAVDPLSARNQPAESPTSARPVAAPDAIDLAAWGLDPEKPAAEALAERAGIQMFVEVRRGDSLESLLARAGAVEADAEVVGSIAAEAVPSGFRPGTEAELLFGDQAGNGQRRVARVVLRDDWGTSLQVSRTAGGGFAASKAPSAGRKHLRRVRGTAGNGLYWSLRAAGVPAEGALDFIAAVSARAGPREPSRSARFDLVLSEERLVYAALESGRSGGVRLVKWPVGDRTEWLDADRKPGRTNGLVQPVAGPVTSAFGYRLHPILRFARFHRGVDFGAPSGAPIRASEGGIVVAAGWNGGYGRQIRIVHPGGLETSYSHLRAIAAPVGGRIRRGEVIGYVGSSGLSTGPHLHYEVLAGGRAIDPLSAPHLSHGGLNDSERARLRLRLRQLLSVVPDKALTA